MIFDKLENIERYQSDLKRILEHYKSAEFVLGKKEIEGNNFFSIGLEYETKPSVEGLWEAHRRYLDVHCVIEGEEIIEISDITAMAPSNEYIDDYQLFVGGGQTSLKLQAGNFLILYPNEVHKTGVIVGERASAVKKFVYKILL